MKADSREKNRANLKKICFALIRFVLPHKIGVKGKQKVQIQALYFFIFRQNKYKKIEGDTHFVSENKCNK